jgi:hypothetical protein
MVGPRSEETRDERNERWLMTIRASGRNLRKIDFTGANVDIKSAKPFLEACDKVEAAYDEMIARSK